MLRATVLLSALCCAAGFVAPASPLRIAAVSQSSQLDISMAHHVQKKATKHHEHSRPRKSRPSDINRTPPQYPPIPDTPWMTPTEGLTQMTNKQKVSIQVSPSDTAADLNSKLQAAGASAVERFVYP